MRAYGLTLLPTLRLLVRSQSFPLLRSGCGCFARFELFAVPREAVVDGSRSIILHAGLHIYKDKIIIFGSTGEEPTRSSIHDSRFTVGV